MYFFSPFAHLFVHLFCSVKSVHHLFGAHKHILLVVSVVLSTLTSPEAICLVKTVQLGVREHLWLVNGKRHGCTLDIECLSVPLFEVNKQLLFDDVDLGLRDVVLLLVLFQLGEHISVSLLHVLHLP